MFKKMLKELHPHPFQGGEMKKDGLTALSLMLTFGRKNRIIESDDASDAHQQAFGMIKSYYLPELEDELASYKVEDSKLKQNRVMALMMGCHWLWRKYKHRLLNEKKQKIIHINPFKQDNSTLQSALTP